MGSGCGRWLLPLPHPLQGSCRFRDGVGLLARRYAARHRGTDRTALVWDVFGLRTLDQKKVDFTREDVDRFWADLVDADAGKAFGVMKVLRANSTPAVSLLKERCAQ